MSSKLIIDGTKLSEFRSFLTEQGKQKSTVDSYTRDLENFFKFVQSNNNSTEFLGLNTLAEYKDWSAQQGFKPSSIRRACISIRVYFRWIESIGLLHSNPFEDAPVPAQVQYNNRLIDAEKINLLFKIAQSEDSLIKSARDLVLLHLLAHEGLKASEIVHLKWLHFFCGDEFGRLTIPGDRTRTIALESSTTIAIRNYRQILKDDSRAKEQSLSSQPLFVSFKGSDARALHWGITRHGIKFALYELGTDAGIPHLNAEQLRHNAIKQKLSLGMNSDEVMNHLGLRRLGKISKHISVDFEKLYLESQNQNV